MGLVLLMFVSGFEIQRSFDKDDKKTVLALLMGATIIPFIAGWAAPSFYDFQPFLGPQKNLLALKIVIAVAVAVTSIPVISKIFIDLNIIHTKFAKIILATATIQDIILWVALAIATGILGADAVSVSSIAYNVALTLTFFCVALLIMPKMIGYSNNMTMNFMIKSSASGYALFICFVFSAIASTLDINIVFGAFLAGVVIGTLPSAKFDAVKTHIKDISIAFFIPIYFAIVGLKIDLIHHFDLTFFLGFLLFTTFFEAAGTFLASKLIGHNFLSSFNFAVAMNARGGPGIVLATVAYDMGIINETFFVTLVMIAITTSLLAGFWFSFSISKGWELLGQKPIFYEGAFEKARGYASSRAKKEDRWVCPAPRSIRR
jgi:Kef-type K+ transport system membrane component KefB